VSTVRNCQLTQLVESLIKTNSYKKVAVKIWKLAMCAIPRDNTSKSTIKQKLSFTPVHGPCASMTCVLSPALHTNKQQRDRQAGSKLPLCMSPELDAVCFFFERERKMLFVN